MRTGSIYIIRNTVNDKVYIGQTTMTVHERFMTHMKPSTEKHRRTYKLYNAVAKYGRDRFYVETIEDGVPLDKLNDLEIEYISKYDSFHNGYNSTPGGDGRIINRIENEDELLRLASSGVNAQDIADQLSVNKATVFRTLHKLGFRYHVDPDEIVVLSKEGYKNQEIAAILGCHVYTVSRALNKKGERKYNAPVKCREGFDISSLESDYYNQLSIGELCNKYGITKTTFYRLKQQYGFKNRPQIYKYKIRNR